jgi:hypothetical protein
MSLLQRLKILPVYPLYLSIFGFAGGRKLLAGGVPEWFVKQFGATILNPFPGALAASFYLIATLELTICALFITSLVRFEFLSSQDRRFLTAALWLAELVFAMLAFGQFLSGDNGGAASLFYYFGLTLVVAQYCNAQP